LQTDLTQLQVELSHICWLNICLFSVLWMMNTRELVMMDLAINGKETSTETGQQDSSLTEQGEGALGTRVGGRGPTFSLG
jgi:hypothetical protein